MAALPEHPTPLQLALAREPACGTAVVARIKKIVELARDAGIARDEIPWDAPYVAREFHFGPFNT